MFKKKEWGEMTREGQMLISGGCHRAMKVPHTTSLLKSPELNSQGESDCHLYICKW